MRTCKLDGCDNSLEGMHLNTRYCSDECRKVIRRAYEQTPKRKYRYRKPRVYDTCQLDGCENSLEGMVSTAKCCCTRHTQKRNREKPENKLRQKAYVAKWKGDNEIKVKRDARAYRAATKEKRSEYQKSYRSSNRDRLNEYIKAWGKENVDKRINHANKRKAREACLPSTFTPEDAKQTLINFSNRCPYCDKPFGDETPHQDHFVPLSRGGPYTSANILLVCKKCNLSKGNKLPQDFLSPKRYQQLKAYLARKDQGLQLTFFATRST